MARMSICTINHQIQRRNKCFFWLIRDETVDSLDLSRDTRRGRPMFTSNMLLSHEFFDSINNNPIICSNATDNIRLGGGVPTYTDHPVKEVTPLCTITPPPPDTDILFFLIFHLLFVCTPTPVCLHPPHTAAPGEEKCCGWIKHHRRRVKVLRSLDLQRWLLNSAFLGLRLRDISG